MNNPNHEVALSFAGENRAYVEAVAECLKKWEISLFYDGFEEGSLWGKNLNDYFSSVYQNATYVVMFISEHYKQKVWTNLERQAAQARALREKNQEYILPARFDNTEILGLHETVGYIDLKTTTPAELALLIAEKLGKDVRKIKSDALPSPSSIAENGKVTFNYSSHNGNYTSFTLKERII